MAGPAHQQYFTSENYLIRAHPLWHKEILPTRHMYLQRYKGKVYLHIRDFTVDEQDVAVIPTTRGVCLNRQQTADLLSEIETLREITDQRSGKKEQAQETFKHFDEDDDDSMIDDDEAAEDDEFENKLDLEPEIKIHIGRNVFVVAKRIYKCVDIREHFFLDSQKIQPTTRGVYLKKEQFALVADALETELVNRWRGLREMGPCHLTHSTSDQEVRCDHCKPRYISPEEKAQIKSNRKVRASDARASNASGSKSAAAAAAVVPGAAVHTAADSGAKKGLVVGGKRSAMASASQLPKKIKKEKCEPTVTISDSEQEDEEENLDKTRPGQAPHPTKTAE